MATTHLKNQALPTRRGWGIALHIWQRLLWKEWRESWPVLAVGVLLPLLLLPGLRNPRWGSNLDAIAFSSVALISILITLWAVNRVSGRMPGKPGTRGVLPLTGLTRWVDLYLPAALVPAIIAVPLGMLVVVASNRDGAPGEFVAAMVLFLLVNYALSTVLARVLSPIPGILAGVTWLFMAFDEVTMDQEMRHYVIVIAAMLLASLPWEALAAKHRYGLGRFAAIFVMAGVIGGLLVYPQFRHDTAVNIEQLPLHGPSRYLPSSYIESSSGGLVALSGARGEFLLRDSSGREIGRVVLDDDVQPLEFIGQTGALFLQQQPGKTARLLAWDARDNQVREVAKLALEPKVFSKAVSPAMSARMGGMRWYCWRRLIRCMAPMSGWLISSEVKRHWRYLFRLV